MPQMTSSPSFPFPGPLQTHSSPLTSLNMFRWGIWVIDFGSSLEALTHKLGIWNILLCLRKGNAAKLAKSTKNLQGLSSLGAELKNFFWLSLQNLSQVLLLMKFHSQVTEIIFVWLVLWKDMMIRYSTVWTLKNGDLVIKSIIYEKVFPL